MRTHAVRAWEDVVATKLGELSSQRNSLVFIFTIQVVFIAIYLLPIISKGSPVSSPDPFIPSIASMMGPLVSVLQTTGVVGGAGGAAAGGAGAAGAVAPVVAGTVATAPVMMAMSSLLPGVGLGLLSAIFIGRLSEKISLRILNY